MLCLCSLCSCTCSCGLLLGTEAPVMTPNSVDFSFFSLLSFLFCAHCRFKTAQQLTQQLLRIKLLSFSKYAICLQFIGLNSAKQAPPMQQQPSSSHSYLVMKQHLRLLCIAAAKLGDPGSLPPFMDHFCFCAYHVACFAVGSTRSLRPPRRPPLLLTHMV